MNIINANAKYLNPDNVHPYKFMEVIGRTCYKSENNITEDSSTKFVRTLMNNGHTAMLEHSHIIIQTTREHAAYVRDELECINNSYITITINSRSEDEGNFISGSFRAFLQLFDLDANWDRAIYDDKMMYVLHNEYPEVFNGPDVEPDEVDCKILSRSEFIDAVRSAYCFSDKHTIANSIIRRHLTHTIKFTCDRGVSHEFVRHRPASFAQESTRYCNYSKYKFGSEITFIRPCFWDVGSDKFTMWRVACENAENTYFDLLNSGATPQEARSVLPNSLKTELIVTATEDEWNHIVNLRYYGTTGKPHPQMVEVMNIAHPLLVNASESRIH